MKAAVLMGPHDLRVMDVPKPELQDDDSIVMRVKMVGICGSDVHAYHGKLTTVTFPRIIGHEVVGEITAVGKNVKHLAVGDHAVIDPVVSCGQCPACRMGRHNVCAKVMCLGVACEGACSEYFGIKAANVHKVPVDIPWRAAVLTEPLTVAAQAVARGDLRPDDQVLIMGAGPIGQAMLQAVKRVGAKAMVTDLVPSRLELARKMGADLVVNPNTDDARKAALDFTGGYGVTLAIDAVGQPTLFELAVDVTAPAGRVVVIGLNPTPPAQISEPPITRKELDIRGSRMNAGKVPEVVSWLAKKEVNPEPLISHEFTLDKIQAAFDLLSNEPEKTCKVVVTF